MLTSQSVVAAFVELKQRQIDTWERASRAATDETAQTAKTVRDGCIEQNKRTIRMLKGLNVGLFDHISLGCLVTLQERYGLCTYLIVPEGGGCVVEVEGERVTAMSIKAPVAQAVLGKKAGEAVLYNGCYFVVCIR